MYDYQAVVISHEESLDEFLTVYLQMMGIDVKVVRALDDWQSIIDQVRPDVILVNDIAIPPKKVEEEVRRKGYHVPVIAVSYQTDNGHGYHLLRPIKISTMQQLLQSLLPQERMIWQTM